MAKNVRELSRTTDNTSVRVGELISESTDLKHQLEVCGSEVGLAPELHGDEGTGTEEAGFHGYALDGGRILIRLRCGDGD